MKNFIENINHFFPIHSPHSVSLDRQSKEKIQKIFKNLTFSFGMIIIICEELGGGIFPPPADPQKIKKKGGKKI